MEITIDRGSAVPLYRQIYHAVRGMILTGTLPQGFRLPPERKLAQSLGVNRSTVLAAYEELKAEALVQAHVGRGTSVLPRTGESREDGGEETHRPLSWGALMRSGLGRVQSPLVRDLLELADRPEVVPLSVGLPAAEHLPMAEVAEVQDRLLRERGAALLLHSPTEGVGLFREALSELMTSRGVSCTGADVLVTSGSQQGLDLVARALLSPGDAVVVEQPSFFGGLQVFRAAQARLLGVPVDDQGMRTDVLEALLARHQPKLIYTLPTFQNPSGAVMSLPRRLELLELAARHGVPVLEDDLYSDLRYEGEAVPSLKALDRHDHVVYLSSFSKVLFPGLRLGWLTAPRPLLRQLVLVKQAVDLHSNTLGQYLLERFLREGLYARHLERVRPAYRARRDAMLHVMEEQAPSVLTWRRPAGGFYVWCTLSAAVSPGRLLARAAERRVSYLPGEPCFDEEPLGNHLRLNFTCAPAAEVPIAVAHLMAAVREAAEEPAARPADEGGTPPIV